MRKLKTKKEKAVEKKDYYNDSEAREKVLIKAKEILENNEVFNLLKHVIEKSDDLRNDIIYGTASFLVAIDKLDDIKDRNEKIKERFRLKNSLTEFMYYVYSEIHPNINTQIFTLLFELNEFLVRYCPNLNNRYEYVMIKEDKKEAYNRLQENFLTLDNQVIKSSFDNFLGYEVAFDNMMISKFQTCVDWISKTLERSRKYNSTIVTKENLENIIEKNLNQIHAYLDDNMPFSQRTFDTFEKEIALFKEFYSRVHLIKKLLPSAENERITNPNLNIISNLEKKKDITHLKSTVTRIDNFLKDLYELIEYGEITGKRLLKVA